MNNNEDSFNNNNQFVVSYELLALLRWFIDHDTDKLKKLIIKAHAAGLKHEIHRLQQQQEMSLDDIHFTIIEFLALLDTLLLELTNEQIVQSAIEKNLIPTIEHIDSTLCDDATVRFSVEKATTGNTQQENPKTVLYRELLKRWKPNKKMVVN